MTTAQELKLIKKLNNIILIGAMIFISTWATFGLTVAWIITTTTAELINSSTTKIISAQTETLGKLATIREVLNMCEEFPPPDPVRLERIDAEIRGNFNNFPSQEEMIEQLENYD